MKLEKEEKEGGGLHAEPHHGQDGPDGVHVDRAVLAEAVEALLQHCEHDVDIKVLCGTKRFGKRFFSQIPLFM